MAKYEIDDTSLKNLMVFLARVDLKGNEAQEFLKIVQMLSTPVIEEPNNDL